MPYSNKCRRGGRALPAVSGVEQAPVGLSHPRDEPAFFWGIAAEKPSGEQHAMLWITAELLGGKKPKPKHCPGGRPARSVTGLGGEGSNPRNMRQEPKSGSRASDRGEAPLGYRGTPWGCWGSTGGREGQRGTAGKFWGCLRSHRAGAYPRGCHLAALAQPKGQTNFREVERNSTWALSDGIRACPAKPPTRRQKQPCETCETAPSASSQQKAQPFKPKKQVRV